MHKWLALSEWYGFPLSASSFTTFNDIVLGTWGSNLMIIYLEKHIYYYLVQDTYSGNFPVNKENSDMVKSRLLSS